MYFITHSEREIVDSTGEREIVQQFDVDVEGVKNDEDGYKRDVSLDFHQLIFDYLPLTVLRLIFFSFSLDVRC